MNNELTPIEKRNKIISAVSTLCVMGLIVLVCALMGMKYPDPPLPEEGVEVNLGNSDMGLGDAQEPDESDASAPVTPPTPSTGENIATQTAPSAAINTTPKPNTRPNDVKETPVKPTETKQPETPKTNTNALFPGRKNTSNGGSQGVTQGSGDQGKQGGDPNSNRYDGQPGNGGTGVQVKGIGDRINGSVSVPPKQAYEAGRIAIDVWIDETGNVVRTEYNQKRSNIYKSGSQRDQCIAAVKRTKYTARPGAGTIKGTIEFTFQNN